jgi:hypothetical protein
MYKIEGGNVQKGLAQGIAQRNYRASSQAIRGNLRSYVITSSFILSWKVDGNMFGNSLRNTGSKRCMNEIMKHNEMYEHEHVCCCVCKFLPLSPCKAILISS